MNIAVILAGGKGTRLGADTPKQFLKVAGKMVIEHTIDVFQSHPQIDEIAVVVHRNYVGDIENIVNNNHFDKVKKILMGGKERYDSSLAAIRAYEDKENVNLIFHDAVRPLVTHRIITDCINALKEHNAVDVVIPTTDTIIKASDDNTISEIPDRAQLRNGQTPQAFKLETIREAYRNALKDPNLKATDDCGIVVNYLPNEKVYLVKGEVFNMKLTYKEDLFLIDKLFQLKSITDELDDESKLTKKLTKKVVVVFGGSYGIGEEVVKICKEHGAIVYSFSRSQNGVDVSNAEQVKEALADVAYKSGKIDYIVSTPGILIKEPLANMKYEDIETSIKVNINGAFIVAKEGYEYLKETHGSLILYTSSSYTRGRAMYSVYSATKAAIVNLVQALAEEWSEAKVRINCIDPERTHTPMRTKNFGSEPLETLLTAEKVALYSINTMTQPITGEVIDVRKK
ncbi:MAG: 2-C-methyl-D-erythritol 4-phosphate cytidylyltransferase [Prevotella sp.]|jgi:2-C-methyl-D-erythritol 4-phosphate cytidylyltransferase|nr:2-C-methyl-D-erythritol 4-phosphate cytidylyltransferase [Prevotella sp.]